MPASPANTRLGWMSGLLLAVGIATIIVGNMMIVLSGTQNSAPGWVVRSTGMVIGLLAGFVFLGGRMLSRASMRSRKARGAFLATPQPLPFNSMGPSTSLLVVVRLLSIFLFLAGALMVMSFGWQLFSWLEIPYSRQNYRWAMFVQFLTAFGCGAVLITLAFAVWGMTGVIMGLANHLEMTAYELDKLRGRMAAMQDEQVETDTSPPR